METEREPLSLDDGLRELSRLVLRDETVETTLDRIVQVAGHAIPGTVGVTITLRKGKQPYTAAATSPQVKAIDEQEYAVDQGPCVDAMDTGEVRLLPDVATETRWPAFTAICRSAGIGSTFGVPLKVGEDTYGAMNLYFARSHAYADDHVEAAELLAAQAGVALANTRTYSECSDRIRQLQEALDTRVIIEQAKGVLMATQRIDDQAAFELLRDRSQRTNRKLRLVAQAVVDEVLTGA
jgi:GAF domain-containing protein